MKRLIHALRHSARAFGRLVRSEAAFQQEMIVLLLSLPFAWVLSATWREFALLVGAVVFLMMVEVLNTAVEATCDAVSKEFRPEIQLAKDCGSLAVFLAILLTGTVWLFALAEKLVGASL